MGNTVVGKRNKFLATDQFSTTWVVEKTTVGMQGLKRIQTLAVDELV